MSIQFSQMQSLLERYGFDTSDPLAAWLNAAKNDFSTEMNWPFNEIGPVTVTMAAASANITLPADYVRPVSLKNNTNLKPMRYVEQHAWIDMIQDETVQGQPEIFTIQAGKIQVYPVAQVSTAYRLVYQCNTPDMALTTDVPTNSNGAVWPSDTHYPIVLNAAFIALMAENEEDRAQQAYKQYNDMKLKLMAKYNVIQDAEMEATQDTQGYGTTYGRRY